MRVWSERMIFLRIDVHTSFCEIITEFNVSMIAISSLGIKRDHRDFWRSMDCFCSVLSWRLELTHSYLHTVFECRGIAVPFDIGCDLDFTSAESAKQKVRPRESRVAQEIATSRIGVQ